MFPDPVLPAITPTPKSDPPTFRRPLRLWLLRALGLPLRARSRWLNIQPPRRVLLVRPDHLGDMLFVTPALRWLRAQLPDAQLTALVGPWGKPAIANSPYLDAIETLEFPGFARKPKGSPFAPYATLRAAARIVRGGRYDTAVILRFDHWWGAWLAALAGIPRRIGYAVPEVAPFLTERVPYAPGRHEVAQNLRLAARLARLPEPAAVPAELPLEFRPDAADVDAARALLATHGIGEGVRFAALAPGSGAAVKLWRLEGFARVADALHAQFGLRVVIVGAGESERALAAQIAAQSESPLVSLAGQTTLGQLAAVLARAAIAIGTDNGPMHLATAAGTPGAHLFGPVSARTFGPWGDPARHIVLTVPLACVPCNRLDYMDAETSAHPCVRLIGERAVLDAAARLLR
ncbi:MAG: glycosyltransferase family 9 protein [Chloroflexi bacterium]|nr:glycosyltransferase family 9 protein [Chloroflexota bacterium]